MRKPKITKEIKELAKKSDAMKWDSSKETMTEYIDRMQKLKTNKK